MRTKENRAQQWSVIEEAHRRRMETLTRLRAQEMASYMEAKRRYVDVIRKEKSGE